MKKTNCDGGRFKRSIRYILTGMVLVSIMLFFSYSETALAQETEKLIRVGIFELPGFSELENGSISGYEYEYLLEIAEITGWKYDFVLISSYEEGLKKLENKEIDLLAPAQRTEEGLSKYLYSDYDFGRQYAALVTDAGRMDLNYEEYVDFQGIQVAVVKDSAYLKNFQKYAVQNRFAVKYVFCESTKEVLFMLHNKEVDAAVVNLLEVQQCDKVLARFNQVSFYYITYKGNEALMQELNAAMSRLQANKPNLLSNLTRIYMPIYDIQYMTPEQRAYIMKSDVIRVGYVQNNIPVSYTDSKTGEFAGITRDILDEVQRLCGLRFEYVPLPEGNIDYQYLKKNNIAITADVVYNKWNRTSDKLVVTMPYDTMNKVFVGKKNLIFYQNGTLRLAMCSGSQTLDEVLKEEYPNFTQLNYETIEEAFDAVLNGEADIVLVNQYVADYWLGRPIYSSMGIIPAEGVGDDHCLAVFNYLEGAETSKMLKNILDVAISQLNADDISMIIFENTVSHRYQYAWRDFLYENKVSLSLGMVIILLVVIVQIIYYVMRKKNYQILMEKERKLAIQQKRYELIIEKTEDIIFETDLQTQEALVSGIMRDTFGWSLDDFEPSKDPDEVMKHWKVHKDDAEVLKKAYLETRMEGKSSECVVRLMKKDIGYVWCKVRRYPIMNEKGEVVKVLGNIVNIDQMTKETQRLKSQTRTDSMTGLLNKNTFIADVTDYLEEEEQVNFCMVFFDLDHFKQVNDHLGHLVGDAAIREAAQKLQINFANVDLISRFGGDEFCIFVKNIPAPTMQDKLEHLREKLCTQYQKLEQTVKITASIGAVYYYYPEKNVQTILEEADRLAYQAKCEGRNRVVFKEMR